MDGWELRRRRRDAGLTLHQVARAAGTAEANVSAYERGTTTANQRTLQRLVAVIDAGAIGATWWSERFVTVLESIGLGSRLQRGRSYARRGQVISLDVDAGAVTAQVQGSRARPYRVRIGLAAYGKTQWTQLEQALAGDAWFTAQLLAGEMPEQIEGLFATQELPLFPATASELSMDCTCPDWQVPCKHIAAVFYLLAEVFDDDPFTILAWRGRDRDTLLDNLAAARSAGPPTADRQRTGKPLDDCHGLE